ncbi:MAG: SOS response-associated peptidase [Alphaproteobacteria bacterium]
MCGRYSITTPEEALRRLFGFEGPARNLGPRYNIAPRQDVPVIRAEGGARRLSLLRWGLVPAWAKDPLIGDKLINARAETIAEKPSFKSAFRARRCLVPADGFYEWRRDAKPAQPFRIEMRDRSPFALAGLWERWRSGAGEVLETFALVTTEANATLEPIHHRMPVILAADNYALWLDAGADAARLRALLKPFLAAPLHAYPIDNKVNSAAHDSPEILMPVEEQRRLI